ncbi:MAG: hypothetical protein ICV65_01710 [Flavisolibacter sp.]|nr:hypothetical protein [Flavisolibacter sp.]
MLLTSIRGVRLIFIFTIFTAAVACKKTGSGNESSTEDALSNPRLAAPGPVSDCAYSQGYWFAKPNSTWCQSVQFGALTVSRSQGRGWWPAKNNFIKKAFFQASALQLSRNCVTQNTALPSEIQTAYNYLSDMLAAAGINGITTGKVAIGYNESTIKSYTDRLSSYIESHHCGDDTGN